jgi:hypothetical protein
LRSHFVTRKPSRHVGTLGDLILANGADYLVRKIVDRAVCSKCGGVEISVTMDVAGVPGYSYPDYSKGR